MVDVAVGGIAGIVVVVFECFYCIASVWGHMEPEQ